MSATISRTRIVDLVCIAVLIAVFLTIALPRYRSGIDWGDEGFLAYGATRVMDGQLPNRDFVSLQPPLSFYIVAMAFKLLGTSLASLRFLGLAVFLLIALSVYGISRILVPPAAALAAALPATLVGIIFNFVPFAVWQGILFTLIAVALYLSAIFRGRHWLSFLGGVSTTFSILSRHDQGFYLIISILVLNLVCLLAKDSPVSTAALRRVFVFWVMGAAIPGVLFALFWWAHDAFPEMWRQLAVFPFSTYRKTSSVPFPHFDLRYPISTNAVAVLFYFQIVAGTLLLIALGRLIVLRRFSMRGATLTFLLTWAGLFFLQVLTRSDINHLLITLPPFFILVAYSWRILLDRLHWPKLWKSVASAVAAALLVLLVWKAGTVGMVDLRKANESLALERGQIRIEQGDVVAHFIRQLQSYVPPTSAVLCLPYQPMFYFLAERRNPTHWNYLWPGDQTPADHQLLIEQAKHDPPDVVLLTGENEMADYAPEIVDFVRREYVKTGDEANVALYVKRPRD